MYRDSCRLRPLSLTVIVTGTNRDTFYQVPRDGLLFSVVQLRCPRISIPKKIPHIFDADPLLYEVSGRPVSPGASNAAISCCDFIPHVG